jgi:hypothetical protein
MTSDQIVTIDQMATKAALEIVQLWWKIQLIPEVKLSPESDLEKTYKAACIHLQAVFDLDSTKPLA